MASFLITNDDGIQSPMLRPMAEKLGALGTVRIVVPSEEQSWKGKAVTRFGRVLVEPRSDFPVETCTVTGTPSDCVNLAIHHLCRPPPDWVISGINIGSNVGLGFIANSGTVGAALEAAFQGIPAVAFSAYLKPAYFRQWNEEKRLTHPESLRTIETTTSRMAAMMARIVAAGLPPGTMVLNINFPGAVTPETPVRWVPVQKNRYGSLFRREGPGFVHAAQVGLESQDAGPNDRDVLMGGEISVTALSLAGISLPPGPALVL
jgi:5'-nucleotidase